MHTFKSVVADISSCSELSQNVDAVQKVCNEMCQLPAPVQSSCRRTAGRSDNVGCAACKSIVEPRDAVTAVLGYRRRCVRSCGRLQPKQMHTQRGCSALRRS